ncbi:hypothetical protein M9458_028955, partial [Cirrhinus mrigala]
MDDLARSTPDPVPSPPSSRCVELKPEPTVDGEPELIAVDEPLDRVTEQQIAKEPELQMTSVQVCEPATTPTTSEKAKASVIEERSSAHCNMTECELVKDLGLLEAEEVFDMDMYANLPPPFPPSSDPTETAIPELSPEKAPMPELSPEEAHKCPLSHLLLPSPLLSSGSPVCLPVSIDVMAGGFPVSASSLRVQDSASACQPSGSIMAPSSLLSTITRQSTGSTRLPLPSGSTLGCRRQSCTSGLHSPGYASCLHPFGSIRLLHASGSTAASRIRASASFADSHLFHLGPPDPPHHPGSLAFHSHLGVLHRCRLAPWSHQLFLLHGSSLRRLH